ncbi:histidine kinase [uncultured Tenacibaculum sp.]|uniref:sensor histidine kinase n=1 Tax=uncultured Tenacibaculum sp. TaxID=174713 RepID=UPI00261C68FC|nr:histidine kinase [uncultured Tenacibaculum sp.]
MNLQSFTKEKKDDNYYFVKVIFHTLYFAIFIFVIINSYHLTLKSIFHKSILTRDPFEATVITLLTYLFYYLVFRSDKLLIDKIKWAITAVVILALISYNKEKYLLFNVLEQLVLYIGLSCILFSFLWTIDNLYIIFNNRFWVSTKILQEAERKLLKQQLNPHFLFNAFNMLYSMSLNNNPKTPDTILKLSGMMRYLTDNSVNNSVKLTQELKFIQEYISIEKNRFGEQANITFEVNEYFEYLLIEPLLLITLVENAFKHGFYTNDTNAFVRINAEINNNNLRFTVENSIQEKQHFQKTREGKGLYNLKKRLKLSYPKTSQLNLIKTSNMFLAELKITLI